MTVAILSTRWTMDSVICRKFRPVKDSRCAQPTSSDSRLPFRLALANDLWRQAGKTRSKSKWEFELSFHPLLELKSKVVNQRGAFRITFHQVQYLGRTFITWSYHAAIRGKDPTNKSFILNLKDQTNKSFILNPLGARTRNDNVFQGLTEQVRYQGF
jgi:hypothetical protein